MYKVTAGAGAIVRIDGHSKVHFTRLVPAPVVRTFSQHALDGEVMGQASCLIHVLALCRSGDQTTRWR